jgi:hypothetical protein
MTTPQIPYDHLPHDEDNHVEPRVIVLSDAQVDAIAERVEVRFYERVGKTVVEKVLKVVGLAALALAVWLAGREFWK